MNSDATKVSPSHLDRDAYLYVRQSTLRQVLENTESTQRQYALRERAIALGWPIERVQVIDCDQGQSGASAADREGFQRLVAEVSLGHAGIVLGLEVSRLARNNSDWHRLLEICALTGTLILDEDGLYDPETIQRSLTARSEGDDLGGGAICPASAAPSEDRPTQLRERCRLAEPAAEGQTLILNLSRSACHLIFSRDPACVGAKILCLGDHALSTERFLDFVPKERLDMPAQGNHNRATRNRASFRMRIPSGEPTNVCSGKR